MYNLRKLFLLDPSVTFLNHGSFGATPKLVFDEYQRWQLELERQPVEFMGLMAESRAALGAYLGTHADNLVYTQKVTLRLKPKFLTTKGHTPALAGDARAVTEGNLDFFLFALLCDPLW